MRRRAAQPKPEIIGEILRKVLKKRNIPHDSTDRRLIDLWARAVGPQIAARTRPEAVKRGTLHVRVSSPVWMHQLQFLKEEICGKINELSGNVEIQGLYLSIGEIPSAHPALDRTTAASPPAPLRKRDREMMRESLATIADPELREILGRVMSKEISRRREREKHKDR
ncbi:MAG: DUF721 domain-containing protein [Deltaproteobacteria bacterium]|nr:DUF721 domain-containing protein [Deltaproteobacteria bacterium]